MLNAGFSDEMSKELVLPKGIEDDEDEKVDVVDKKMKKHGKSWKKIDRSAFKSKDWIIKKKERARLQGKTVKNDSKYTGRRRPGAF